MIDWDSILRDILHSWWMVVIAALTTGLIVGGILELRYKPLYRSSATFLIGRSGFSHQEIYDNLTQAETTTKQYAQVVSSSILRGRVCEDLGLPSFDASVNVSVVESTNLMILTVTADSPGKAFLINRSVYKNAKDLMGLFLDNVTMMELEAARIPGGPANALSLRHDMLLAALLGASAMVCLLAYISSLKETIKTPEDINRKVDTPLLGTIYYEKKHGCLRKKHFGKKRRSSALLVSNPMQSFGFLESYRMLSTRVRHALERGNKKVLMVVSISENEGKSTVCANLALSLAQQGKRVILIDCDFRKPSLYKIFETEVSEEADLGTAIREKRLPKFGKIASEQCLYTLFCRQPQMKIWDFKSLQFFNTVLKKLREHADYILIDSSPMAFVSDAEEYVTLADACLLVVRQDLMEASYINDAVDNLEDTGTELLGCVLNGVRRGVIQQAQAQSRYYGSVYGNYSHYRQNIGKKEEQG